ncbi:MAG: PilX N-terminal domain-containing pilus assembly protein [Nitrospirota bacterium]
MSRAVNSEQGFVLVVALLALLVLTVVGVLSLSTSTTEVMVAGNTRLREINFSGAESGLEITDPAIRHIIFNMAFGNYDPIVVDKSLDPATGLPNFVKELITGPSYDATPDLQLNLGTMTVSVDIDRISSGPAAGSAIEFASGYEGIGMGSGGGIEAYYRVNSMSSEAAGSENCIGGVYRYVAY